MNKEKIRIKVLLEAEKCSYENWGGDDEWPVTEQSRDHALALVNWLPDDVPDCKVWTDSDGSLNFQWLEDKKRVMIFEENEEWVGCISGEQLCFYEIELDRPMPQPMSDIFKTFS